MGIKDNTDNMSNASSIKSPRFNKQNNNKNKFKKKLQGRSRIKLKKLKKRNKNKIAKKKSKKNKNSKLNGNVINKTKKVQNDHNLVNLHQSTQLMMLLVMMMIPYRHYLNQHHSIQSKRIQKYLKMELITKINVINI